jgi:hypothetical protein
MTDKIVLRRKDRLKLIEKFGISESTCSQIINFRRHTLQASKIRVYAVNFLNGIYLHI